ncbi:uncharacterized protein LOC112563530 isoform X3 [Pomacea canaliculata]|uniref:uncharacterized protein LOC112563530 isoform X3 n=1 Tax=Pomacea canaliculata TaxID=400727 RepID=UPI000D727C69|nr:uncharacterized protein LOC112563530 isoform X3 [Pomacea canaliculata]
MDEESASKFINALIKSVQTLCHGYVDFNNGVEIIGYINLSVDKGSSFDYVLKEKVCKNEENSTLFISNSFHAQPKPDKPVKAKNGQVETHISQRRHSVDTSESNQLSSAISSISTVLSGSHSQEKSRSIFSAKDSPASSSSSSSHHIQSTAKRKGEDDVNHDHPPKAANLSHESSSQHFFHPESSPHVSATSSPVDSKPSMSDVAGNVGESSRRTSTVTSEEMQPHIAGTMLPQTATVTSDANSDLGVNLASSVLERIDDQSNSEMQEKDDSDLDLEVTFIKEEYVEGERSACEFQNSGGGQYGRGPDQRASTSSDSMADTPLYPVALHTSAAAATFAPGSHEMAAMAQHYSGIPSSSLGIGAGPSTSHQPGPSGMREWLLARGKLLPSPQMSLPELDDLLCLFYKQVRRKTGSALKEHGLRKLKNGLVKYFTMMLRRSVDLLDDSFLKSNQVFDEVLSKAQPTKGIVTISPTDCTFLRGHHVLAIDTPVSLLRKVWFELQLHFGARRWSPQEMDEDTFDFRFDDCGREYVCLKRAKMNKADLRPEVTSMILDRRMYARGGPYCPVAALRFYLSKRVHTGESGGFLQMPNSQWRPGSSAPWYLTDKLSIAKARNFMRDLAVEVKLGKEYTNTSLILWDISIISDCWPDQVFESGQGQKI